MKLCRFSANVLGLGVFCMAFCLLCSFAAFLFAPYSPQPHHILSIARSLAEAGPASLAAAVCASLICDVVTKKERS